MKGAEKRGYTIDGWDTPKGGNLNTKKNCHGVSVFSKYTS
jgi:hypothetical protein